MSSQRVLSLLPAESDGESRKVGGQTLVQGHSTLARLGARAFLVESANGRAASV